MKIKRDKKVNFIRSFRLKIAIYTLISLICTIATDVMILFLFFLYHRQSTNRSLQIQQMRENSSMQLMAVDSQKELYRRIYDGFGLTGSIWVDIVILVGFSAILFTAYFILVSHNMVNYLREIQTGVERIKEGDFDTNIRVLNEDELSGMANSINEMRYTVKELMEKERMAEKAKNDLITNVAHDLRTPLTSIIGYLELLKNDEQIPSETKNKYLHIVYDKAKRLQGLVVDLFDYTRYAKDGIKIRKAPLELNRFLEQLLEEFYPSFQDEMLECHSNLWKEDIHLQADGELLARAFGNLLSNAIKYGSDGKLIIIKTKVRGKWAVVSITNFGQIIPKSDLNKIFEKFYRVESSRSLNTGGTGLGLAITKNIIMLHQGLIDAKSDENGTIFEVSLPLEEKEEV